MDLVKYKPDLKNYSHTDQEEILGLMIKERELEVKLFKIRQKLGSFVKLKPKELK